MYIIDKNHDFYDHWSHVYGVDKSIVFDRRGSLLLTDDDVVRMVNDTHWYNDRDTFNHLLLEVGDTQYLIGIQSVVWGSRRYTDWPPVKAVTYTLLHTYDEHRHMFEGTMTIRQVQLDTRYVGRRKERKKQVIIPSLDEVSRKREYVPWHERELPILGGTSLTTILDAFEVWKSLSTYISSLANDKTVDTLGDVAKAQTHGFDEHSFRNPIKL